MSDKLIKALNARMEELDRADYQTRLHDRCIELEEERNDHMHRAHEAQEQMQLCHRILDRIGAPRNQDNGLSYNLNGRLSRLIRNETGKLWEAELRKVEVERDRMTSEVMNILKSASPHPEDHPTMHHAWDQATATIA